MKAMIKKIMIPLAFCLSAAILIISCAKEESFTGGGGTLPDFVSKVTASKVSGIISDLNGQPVKDANITVGNKTTTTDKFGYFEVRNAMVTEQVAVVKVSKAGYFNGIRSFAGEAGKSAFVKITLITKQVAGSIDATTGGEVATSTGLKIKLPAQGVMTAAGAPYTGSVRVAAYWINPTGSNLTQEMPGDLRGITTNNEMKVLTTFGMAAVELTSPAGEKLQVATGKKATVSFPIPATLSNGPAIMPMWYFDEERGVWKEEGSGNKVGNEYVADLSHFSFWNCDVPASYVRISMTVVNAAGAPLAHTGVKITNNSSAFGQYAYGFTDSAGYVSGLVPANSNLTVEVMHSYSGCSAVAYTQSVTTTSANINLGTITATPPPANQSNLTATILSCSGQPVAGGRILLLYNGYPYQVFTANASGVVQASFIHCGNPSLTWLAYDATNQQESTPVSITPSPTMALGSVQACGVSTAQFWNITVNGTNYSYTAPADSLMIWPRYTSGTNNYNQLFLSAYSSSNGESYMRFTSAGIAVGSTQTNVVMKLKGMADSSTTALPITITELGTQGQFISGNFNGTVNLYGTGAAVPVSGNFRVRKYF